MKTMRDIIEIRKTDNEELLAIAKLRIEDFEILRGIYDDAFLFRVVQGKRL
jgi:hypothetical protein